MNKKLIIPVVAAALLGVTVIGVNQVSAQGYGENQNTLVQKIATAFGLNETEVQTVINQARTERQVQLQQEMQTKLEERLNKAVQDGQITEEQKALILAKHEEMRATMEPREPGAMRDMSDEERAAFREEIQTHHDELEAWAEQNGIDMSYLMFGGPGVGGPKGLGEGAGVGMDRGMRGGFDQ